MSALDYEELQNLVNKLSADISAAELDGLMAGLLVRGPSVPVAKLMRTLKEYLDDAEVKQLDALQQGYLIQLVAQLAEHAQQLHALDDMEWAPLLPTDDYALSMQLQALADWCGGFIHGSGIALSAQNSPSRDNQLPEASQELLSDLAEISRVDVDQLEHEDSENDYVELLEYVRTAAFTCVLEFANDLADDSSQEKPVMPAPAGRLQ